MTLYWTKEKPARAGWYWMRHRNAAGDAWCSPSAHHIRRDNFDWTALGYDAHEWAGPLPEPIEPPPAERCDGSGFIWTDVPRDPMAVGARNGCTPCTGSGCHEGGR
jgi:hypothetical protein